MSNITAPENASSASNNTNGYDDWENVTLTFSEWIAMLCGVVAFWIFLSFLLAYFLGPDFLTCYLCHQQVPRKFWLSGEHRIECAKNHAKFLDELPCPSQSVRCPICYRPLRLWPEPKDETMQEFVCLSHRRCAELDEKGMKKPLINNGQNRMNCFNCDYDICNLCAASKPPTLLTMRSNDTTSPTEGPAPNRAWTSQSNNQGRVNGNANQSQQINIPVAKY